MSIAMIVNPIPPHPREGDDQYIGNGDTSSSIKVKTEKAFTQKHPAERHNDLSINRMIG